jgi:hypothetical protein
MICTTRALRVARAKSYPELEGRHCERSEAIHLSFFVAAMDCFASLAMTAHNWITFGCLKIESIAFIEYERATLAAVITREGG